MCSMLGYHTVSGPQLQVDRMAEVAWGTLKLPGGSIDLGGGGLSMHMSAMRVGGLSRPQLVVVAAAALAESACVCTLKLPLVGGGGSPGSWGGGALFFQFPCAFGPGITT